MGYCYTLFSPGLNGDGPHSVYYDLTPEECESYGYGFYPPGSAGDPYWNSNCTFDCNGVIDGTSTLDDCGICDGDNSTCTDCAGVINGDALIDDCGICQSSYCYDFVTHQTNTDFPCDGEMEMLVEANSASNPNWNSSCGNCVPDCSGSDCGDDGCGGSCGTCGDNQSCENGTCTDMNTDCNGIINGSAMVDDCGDCQSSYCYDYVSHQVSFGACDGPTQMFVEANSPSNPYWNQSCTDCAGVVNGSSMVDECGVCDGDNSSCTDCNGIINGTSMEDACGVCDGDGSTCADCNGVVNGGAMVDDCGV